MPTPSIYHLPIRTSGRLQKTVFGKKNIESVLLGHIFGYKYHTYGLTDFRMKGCTSETAHEVCPEDTL